jgi:predicted PurR-regulated permease PerM
MLIWRRKARQPSGFLPSLGPVFFFRAARTLLIPIALAVLISYALEPVVTWLELKRVPRWAGAAIVLLAVLVLSAGGVYALRDDARHVVEMLPSALEKARDIIATQLGSSAQAIQQAPQAVGTTGEATSGGGGTSGQVASPVVQRIAAAVVAFAGHLVVIVFLAFFLLISHRHVRNRLVEIAGPDRERRRMTSTIVDDINAQIQRYLLVLLVTSIMVGSATWGVLAAMGVEQAGMWGLLAGLFNSIPYFGPVIVAGGLLVVGLAQGGGLVEALRMSGAAIAITSLEGWLVTPALMGKAEGMSALAVFLGLLVWTWLWGAWGTVLAVPMLVIVKSVADHVERFKPLGRLMAP